MYTSISGGKRNIRSHEDFVMNRIFNKINMDKFVKMTNLLKLREKMNFCLTFLITLLIIFHCLGSLDTVNTS
jgi:hypothetical protein